MAYITLDFESPYSYGVRKDHPMYGLSLSKQTYEEYIHDPRFKPFGFSYQIDDGDRYWIDGDERIERTLKTLFAPGNEHTMIAQNALFDGAILSWYYGLAAKRYQCTKMMSKALWPQRSSSLKQLCISCYPDDENIRKGTELIQFANKSELTPEERGVMAGYCNNDVDVTWACYKAMWPHFPDDELELIDMTLKMGIHPTFQLDVGRVYAFLEQYNAETEAILSKPGVPSRTILKSAPKFANWCKEELDIEIPLVDSPTEKNPDNKKYALSKDSMEFIALQLEHTEYQHIWDARLRCASTIDRTRATRLLAHVQDNGYIATPLNYYNAHTGRWAGTNKVNFQNLRRDSELRKSLVAPPGYMVVVADLNAIEPRMHAAFAEESILINQFAQGIDPYCDFASQVFYREITKDNAMERFVGKTGIISLGYQVGPPKFRNTLYLQGRSFFDEPVVISLEESKHIVYDVYRGRYTQIVDSWAQAENAIQLMMTLEPGQTVPWRWLEIHRGMIRLPNGMYLQYPQLESEPDEQGRPQVTYWNGEYRTNLYGGKLIENLVQALSRIVLASMMLEINRNLTNNPDVYGEHARGGLTVHDEIISIAREESAQQAFDMKLAVMKQPPAWADKLALKAEGGIAKEYSK